MLAFNTLTNRYFIKGRICFDGAVHVGSGLGDDRADDLFVRSNGQFYIPGSSVRGALRSLIERNIAGLIIDDAFRASTTCLLSASSGSKCVSVNKDSQDELKDWFESQRKESDILNDLVQKKYLCNVCRVFGSPYFASKVKIHDCFPQNPEDLPGEGVVRTGIGIDRDTESVREGVLFEVEVLDKNPAFVFELMAENLEADDPADWGLLSLGLLEMVRGNFYLGAKSAAGLGKCRLDENSLEIKGFCGSIELAQVFSTGFYPRHYKKDTEVPVVAFLQKKVGAYLATLNGEFEQSDPEHLEKEN